jgi:four helix bundle protein
LRPHKNLKAWQEAIGLVKVIYTLTKSFPDDEKFGIISQFRRASVSVPLNIAEGAGRSSLKEYCHFLDISLGSLSELDTLLLISLELNYINPEIQKEIDLKVEHVSALIYGLQKSKKNQIPNP